MEAIFSQIPQAILTKAINDNNIQFRKKARLTEEYEPYISDSRNNQDLNLTSILTEPDEEEEADNEIPKFSVPVIISKKADEPIKSIMKPKVIEPALNDPRIKSGKEAPFLPDSSSSQKTTMDAMIQTEPGPVMISRYVQTDPILTYDDYKQRMIRESMSTRADPVYSLKNDNPPPLKVGLSLGGRKRKVYYPDEDDE